MYDAQYCSPLHSLQPRRVKGASWLAEVWRVKTEAFLNVLQAALIWPLISRCDVNMALQQFSGHGDTPNVCFSCSIKPPPCTSQ